MIASQVNTGIALGETIETMDDETRASIYLLNGCNQIRNVDLQRNTIISVTGTAWTGEAKLMLLDHNHDVTYLNPISQETDAVTVLPGSYQVVIVGYWFSGSVLIETADSGGL